MYKFYIILTSIILILIGCKKEELIPNDLPTLDGVYIGNTYQENKWATLLDGYKESDTTFNDTFFVNLVSMDSILFSNKGKEYKFIRDTSHNYMEWYGTHSNRIFKLKTSDSLSVSYWSYGGYGPAFNQTNKTFMGTKQ